jgi:hypothetical protein
MKFNLSRVTVKLYQRPSFQERSMTTDNRSEGRSNVFLTATLSGAAGQLAVRIRNISPHGALIQGSSLPSPGSKIRLTRGRLAVAGDLAWEGSGHAGLNFDSEIVVADWVRRAGHEGQQRVDQILAALQTSDSVPEALQTRKESSSLAAVSATLDALCERLANQPNMSLEVGEELIKLDAIAQLLRELAAKAD